MDAGTFSARFHFSAMVSSRGRTEPMTRGSEENTSRTSMVDLSSKSTAIKILVSASDVWARFCRTAWSRRSGRFLVGMETTSRLILLARPIGVEPGGCPALYLYSCARHHRHPDTF